VSQATLPQNDSLSKMQSEEGTWQNGEILLNTYEVKGVVAIGGMGVVYRVHHKGWNTDLALKSPRPDLSKNKEQIDNYKRECETWIDLGLHPNVVTCYYVREINGLPRIFTEFISGGSLRDWIDSKKLYQGSKENVLERIIDIAIQSAWGLNFAHSMNVIHQDVKPSNILVENNGIAKITDFGIARARKIHGSFGSSQETIFSAVGGMTPEYCSPEQANGRLISRKSDIWSWALSILEMFIGEITWASGVMAHDILNEYLKNGSSFNEIPSIPNDLAELLASCFSINPQERPNSFEVIFEKLSTIYKRIFNKEYPRKKVDSVVLLADSSNNRGVSLWDIGKYQDAIASWNAALKLEPLHAQATYNKNLVLWRSGQITDQQVIRNLELVQNDQPDNNDLKSLIGEVHLERGNYGLAIKTFLDITDERTKKMVEAKLDFARSHLEFSRDLKCEIQDAPSVISIAFINQREAVGISGSKNSFGVDDGSDVTFWDLEHCNIIRRFHLLDGISSAWFDPIKSLLITGRMGSNRDLENKNYRDKINVWNLRTEQKIKSIDGYVSGVTTISVDPDGRSIIAGGYSKEAGIWSTITGTLLINLPEHNHTVTCATFTADLQYCFTGEGFINFDAWGNENTRLSIKMWDVQQGGLVKEFIGHTGSIKSMCVHNQNQLLASASDDTTIRVWNINTGQCIRILKGHNSGVNSVAFLKNGKYLLSASNDTTVRLWDIQNSRCLYTYEGLSGPVNVAVLSPTEGTFLSGGSDKLILWTTGLQSPQSYASLALCYAATTETTVADQSLLDSYVKKANLALSTKDYLTAKQQITLARLIPSHNRNPKAIQIWQALYKVFQTGNFKAAWSVARFIGDEAFYERNLLIGKTIALRMLDRSTYNVENVLTHRVIKKIRVNTIPSPIMAMKPAVLPGEYALKRPL